MKVSEKDPSALLACLIKDLMRDVESSSPSRDDTQNECNSTKKKNASFDFAYQDRRAAGVRNIVNA